MNFEINHSFLIKPFFLITKKSRQKYKYSKTEKTFLHEIKSIFHHFQRAFNCLKLSQTREWAFNIKSEFRRRSRIINKLHQIKFSNMNLLGWHLTECNLEIITRSSWETSTDILWKTFKIPLLILHFIYLSHSFLFCFTCSSICWHMYLLTLINGGINTFSDSPFTFRGILTHIQKDAVF